LRLADLRARGSPTIGRRLLERGLIDEIDLHIAPVLFGDGIRLFDKPWGDPVRLELLNGDDPSGGVPQPPPRTNAGRSRRDLPI
jgi:dihydrofolate reductase